MDFREYVGSNARVMAPKTLNRLIIALYEEMLGTQKQGKRHGVDEVLTLPEFIMDYLTHKYGLKKLAVKHVAELVASTLKYHAGSDRIGLFARLVSLHEPFISPETYCDFVMKALGFLTEYLGGLPVGPDGSCIVPLEVAMGLLPSIFPKMGIHDMEVLEELLVAQGTFSKGMEQADIDLDAFLAVCVTRFEERTSVKLKVLKEEFTKGDCNGDGLLTLQEFSDILRASELFVDEARALQLYKKAIRFDGADSIASHDPDCITPEAYLAIGLQEMTNIEHKRWLVESLDHMCELIFKKKKPAGVAFRELDTQRDGTITPPNFRTALRQVCPELTLAQMDQVVHMAEHNSAGRVMYLDFLARFQTVFAATLRHQLGPDWDERVVQRVCEAIHQAKDSLRSVFGLIDTSGDDAISSEEFKLALTELGVSKVGDDIVDAMVMLMDTDHNGTVDYKEFIAAFKVVDTKARVEESAITQTNNAATNKQPIPRRGSVPKR